ncbi:MAG: carbohydrate kinase [Gammaproteobacteria bacterium]|uniref:carbohydrate kinase family protein n=1 Tax=Pseudomaricurvus alcaniphilus TaxID=1166482 RepID=UPI0014098929|nr:carbohydrate kinase [Pseudomaricurvus alcaniphilus]MBR9912274.1 carbohydrate kinase [Gammaproteobacteria bacterium]NHN37339.1 carbohydrate kinase [Pseudomaricurvus alcaniphilus]
MILCNGEALIDMIPARDSQGNQLFRPLSGGAIFNTAIALGRLHIKVGMLTGLSSDLFGRQLLQSLQDSEVDTSLVITSDRPTTLAFVELTDGHASYTFYDENTAGRMLGVGQLPQISASYNALYFGGISLCSEPGADTYLALAEREAGQRVIVIDPNIRAPFITDESTYRARIKQFLQLANIIKVSDEDLNWLVKGDDGLADKVARLTAKRPAMVIVTRGSQGASAWLADGSQVDVPSQRVEVVDTVGAGDTFNAGVLANLEEAGLLTKDKVDQIDRAAAEQALNFGAKVAAITVSRAGANPPWRNEL